MNDFDYKFLLLGELVVIIFAFLRARRKLFISPLFDINSSNGQAATFNYWFFFGNFLLLFLFTLNTFVLFVCVALWVLRIYLKDGQKTSNVNALKKSNLTSKSATSKSEFVSDSQVVTDTTEESRRIHIIEEVRYPQSETYRQGEKQNSTDSPDLIKAKPLADISMPVKVSVPQTPKTQRPGVVDRSFRVIEKVPESPRVIPPAAEVKENLMQDLPENTKTISIKTKRIYCDGCQGEHLRNRFYESGQDVVYFKCKICGAVMKRIFCKDSLE